MTDQPIHPAAQVVYNAVLEICPAPADEIAAAALRAAADQVVPEEADLSPLPPTHEMIENPLHSLEYEVAVLQRQETRLQFLAIAAELEGGND
jgi:hypothetical protein